ncbi:hypothetical protein EYF80_031376 [Liparis tanakae]|uniref:Uncharacterized protein n=1 Tax=Liparis tanakae TaxID=230148 RepID=A0A4Z2GZA1_9TELE|nr:hypothetical protein EYF80_031376 [Liparis tanakae]
MEGQGLARGVPSGLGGSWRVRALPEVFPQVLEGQGRVFLRSVVLLLNADSSLTRLLKSLGQITGVVTNCSLGGSSFKWSEAYVTLAADGEARTSSPEYPDQSRCGKAGDIDTAFNQPGSRAEASQPACWQRLKTSSNAAQLPARHNSHGTSRSDSARQTGNNRPADEEAGRRRDRYTGDCLTGQTVMPLTQIH